MALEGFTRAGVAKDKETYEIYDKFLTSFEKAQGAIKTISLAKLLTCVLLLSRDS